MKQVQIKQPLMYKQLALETPLPDQSRPQNGERDNKELFLTLHEVQLRASKLKECCIFICGDTRTGKSTLHNCIVNPNVLVGQEEGLNNYYVLRDSNNPQVAKIGSSLKSVTMMPNVSVLNAQTSIVDLPGMGERGQGIEVIKVNFINAKFFSTPKKAKFIVVFTQGALKDIDNGGFKDTLNNFLTFFNSQHFSSVEGKRQLFSSVAFCFTSVDFRRKPYEKVKEKYLSQILVMLDKLEKWYQVKKSEMPTFPLAKELIKTIVAQKRIQLFELAVEGQSPPHNKFLQAFDKCQWKYLSIKDKIDQIVYPYDEQYNSLDKTQRDLVDNIINQRFQFCLKLRTILGLMMAKVFNNFGQVIIDIEEELKQLETLQKLVPNYGNLVQDLEDYQQCTSDQRLLCFQSLDDSAKKVMDLDSWKIVNKTSSLSEYFTKHLARMFDEQIIIIKKMFSYSQAALKLIKKIEINVIKMLAQAAIFSRLSPNYQSKLKRKFADQITFGTEILPIQQIKQKFIDYFHNIPLRIQDFRTDDLKKLIKLFITLKGEFKEMDPTIFYGISFKLKRMLAHTYRSNNMTTQFVEQSYSSLIEAVKQHICFFFIPLSSTKNELQRLVNMERIILRQTEQVFLPEKNKNRNNGNIQLKLAFESLLSCKDRDEFKSVVKSIFMIFADFMRAQFRNVNLTKDQILPAITVSSHANNEVEIHSILSEYHTVMYSQINEEKIEIPTPVTYSLSKQAEHYQKIKEKIRNKKIILVYGEHLGGKSSFIQIFKQKKMTFDGNGKIDLQKQSRFNKINHTNISSRYPNVTPLNENELFVEIPFFHDLPQQEKYIKGGLLSSLMRSVSKLNIFWVTTLTTFKSKAFENSISQFIRLLQDKKVKQPKECVINLVVNLMGGAQVDCRKILQGHIESMMSADKKVAKYLNCMMSKHQFICEGINDYAKIANDFQVLKAQAPELDTSKFVITYGELFNKFTPDKDGMIKHIISKISLIRKALNPLQGLAYDSLNEFIEGTQISDKNWFHNDITQCLKDPILKGYETDISTLPKHETIAGLIENRPYVYYKAIELKKIAEALDSQYEFDETYKKYGNYMQNFFSNMVFLCCLNKQQYTNFMKLRIIFAILLKELEYYSLIFKDVENPDYKLEQLNCQLRFRDITDRMTNFTEMSGEELMQRLMRQPSKWKENQLRSYIELLFFFIKTKAANTQVSIAARIELLVFMLRLKPNKNFVMNWDKDLTEKKLIESIFSHPFVQKNSSKNLLAFGKLQQQASEKTLSELADLKMRLIA